MMRKLASGLIGAIALTALNETLRRRTSKAPRLDVLGERATRRGLKALGLKPTSGSALYGLAMAQDLVANTLFYALLQSFRSRSPVMRGGLGGGLAGLATVLLAPKMGLGRLPRGVRTATQLMTAAYYLTGGLASGAAQRALAPATTIS